MVGSELGEGVLRASVAHMYACLAVHKKPHLSAALHPAGRGADKRWLLSRFKLGFANQNFVFGLTENNNAPNGCVMHSFDFWHLVFVPAMVEHRNMLPRGAAAL